MAKAYATSDIVPAAYRNKVANCIIALQMAHKMKADPMSVMQSLYIVHGNPGWSSKFLIATFNQCGRFTAIRYTMERDSDDKPFACRAWTEEKRTGERLEGTRVTLDMAKAEGWSTKAGSKWITMPELMLQYRAAAFLIRTYAPEISMGLHSVEEVEDIAAVTVAPKAMRSPLRLSQDQMNDIAARIENGVTTQEEVIAKYPDLVEDQKEEIMSFVFNSAGND